MHSMIPTLLAAFLVCGASVGPASAGQDDSWKGLKRDVFGERQIAEASPLVTLSAPTRAEDAAMVPIDIKATLPPADPRTIRRVTVIVDENPAPVAATFTFGRDRRDVALSTRLRVNAYSNVRAIAETSDGALHMAASFVKASGGCSAPALKDPDAALARIGEMRLKVLAGVEWEPPRPNMTPVSKAQLMIRHPNYSGLQMDQLTRLYIPAKFVSSILVRQGEETVFEMEGGISLSEDPAIQFSYAPNGRPLEVRAEDTDGRVFTTALSGS